MLHLLLLDVLRVQITWRAGVTAEAVVHVLAVNFEGEEEVFVGGIRGKAGLGGGAEETLAGAAHVTGVREGVFRLGEECLNFITG